MSLSSLRSSLPQAIVWVQYAVRVNMSKFHSKVHFYKKFMWGVTAWLFMLPLITVIAGASEEEARTAPQAPRWAAPCQGGWDLLWTPDISSHIPFPRPAGLSSHQEASFTSFPPPQSRPVMIYGVEYFAKLLIQARRSDASRWAIPGGSPPPRRPSPSCA